MQKLARHHTTVHTRKRVQQDPPGENEDITDNLLWDEQAGYSEVSDHALIK